MRDSRSRAFVRLTFANPASLVYLGLVVAAALSLVFASATGDTGFAAVWILLITAPTSMFLLLPDFTNGDSALATGYFLAALALSALLHAFLLGLVYRGVRGGTASRVHASA